MTSRTGHPDVVPGQDGEQPAARATKCSCSCGGTSRRSARAEHRFIIYPLGAGKRFFRDGSDKSTLQLKRAETSSTGVTMLVCEPAG
jgi:hypothetical protein